MLIESTPFGSEPLKFDRIWGHMERKFVDFKDN